MSLQRILISETQTNDIEKRNNCKLEARLKWRQFVPVDRDVLICIKVAQKGDDLSHSARQWTQHLHSLLHPLLSNLLHVISKDILIYYHLRKNLGFKS